MVRPKFENFHSYCEERKYKKYGFDAKAVFDSLNGNGWLLPNGECLCDFMIIAIALYNF